MPEPASLSRSERRKRRTRLGLIEAAQRLARANGLDNVTMQDITEQADVGLGTFYNYFESKADVYEAVNQELQAQFFDELDEIKAGIKDPAMGFAFSLRFWMENLVNMSDWAWFSKQSSPPIRLAQTERLIQEIQRAIDAGRFSVDSPQFVLAAIDGIIDSTEVMLREDPTIIDDGIYCILRMLGMSESESKTLSTTPLRHR